MSTKTSKKAFSLIELSIVLVIISVLIAGTLSVSVTGLNNAKIKITNDRIAAIYKAMGNYLQVNKTLPCPASLRKMKTESNYGTSVGSAGACFSGAADGVFKSNNQANVMYGMVPVKTLGLANEMGEDGFGNKFVYVVNKAFTLAEYPTATDNSGFSYHSTSGNDMLLVLQMPSTNTVDGVVMAIISLGINKYGAFNATSSSPNGGSADTYEPQNYLANIVEGGGGNTADYGVNATYSGRVVLASSSTTSDTFDDIVFFKSRNDLVTDFDAQYLLPCTSSTTGWASGYTDAFVGQIRYRSTTCSAPNDSITPSKKCAALGLNWASVQDCP